MPNALIVEDNPMNRKLLRDILEFRFTVWESESAEQARELLASSKPDVIFLDMQLPGIDGVTFAKQLKLEEATAQIPIVGISADAMQHNIDQALEAGCIEYVTKPITEDPIEFADRMWALIKRDD